MLSVGLRLLKIRPEIGKVDGAGVFVDAIEYHKASGVIPDRVGVDAMRGSQARGLAAGQEYLGQDDFTAYPYAAKIVTKLVEQMGIKPTTSSLRTKRSIN